MNVVKLFSSTLILLFIVACSNDELENMPQSNLKVGTKAVLDSAVELSVVAQVLASIEIDRTTMSEVKAGVERSLKYGLDEEYRFTDMLRPTLSKLHRSYNKSFLIESMDKGLKSSASLLKANQSNTAFFDLLSQNDIQIYWPYSKIWDKSTKPIILYKIEDDNLAYKPVLLMDGTFRIDTIELTVPFLRENTVWIVSENKTKYDELPDFENGEFVNRDGVFFYSEIANEWLKKTNARIGIGSPVYIGSINFWDSNGLDGGPEIDFVWGHISEAVGSIPMQGVINRYRVNLSAGEISENKQLNLKIQPSWTTSQKTNALVIIEKDGGKDKKMTRAITYVGLDGKEKNVDISIGYERRDDMIFDRILERKRIFSSENKGSEGDWLQYEGSGMYFTLPTE